MQTIKINSTTLLEVVEQFKKVRAKNPALVVLEKIRLFKRGDTLFFHATNLDVTAVAGTKEFGEATAMFECLLPWDAIKFIKLYKDTELTISIDKHLKVEIQADGEKGKWTTHDFGEFPKIPTIEPTNRFAIIINKEHIESLMLFRSGDELRPVMCGINVDIVGKQFKQVLVSTDAHKLLKIEYGKLSRQKTEKPISFIMPDELVSCMNFETSRYDVEIGGANGSINNENITWYFRRILDRYPNYEAVIPPQFTNQFTFEKADMLSKLKKCEHFMNKTTKMLALNLAPNKATIHVEDFDYDKEFTAEFKNCEVKGKIEIGFNKDILESIIRECNGDSISLLTETSSRAAIIKEENKTMLLMPVLLNKDFKG